MILDKSNFERPFLTTMNNKNSTTLKLHFLAYSKTDYTMNITKFTHILFSTILLLFLNTSASFSQNCAELDGTIWVTNTNDEGFGSLREAINCANNNIGPNHIKFNITGNGEHRIFVGSTSRQALPSLIDAGTIIDGSTESDFGINDDYSPKIILDGELNNWTLPINALFILADNCAIYSLEITNFPDDGIDVYQADNVTIGAANRGNIIYKNGSEQDIFPNVSGLWEGCGIVLRSGANNCRVRGNIIGTNKNLSPGLGNEFCGIINRSGADGNIIGGENLGEANIIAYNPLGIRIDNSVSVKVQQNSLFCNDTMAIQLRNNANFNKASPIINTANTNVIAGIASPGDKVEVFVSSNEGCPNAPCQGKTLLGTVMTNANGSWTLSGNPFAGGVLLSGGEMITATTSDQLNNTSVFSACVNVINTSSCASNNGTIWVTNTNDEGEGSLRAAIDCANSTSGANTIKFDIPGTGAHRIFVGSATGRELPALMDDRTIIDASTQPGYGIGGNYSPKIILDGIQNTWLAAINAIWILGDFCEVYALEITNFPDDGIDVSMANFARIGDVNKGNVIYNVGAEQDFFPNSNSGPWEGCAIVMKSGASNCTIRGNILGTNYNRTLTIGNEYCGIIVQHGGDNHIIGGNQAGQANVIAYNQVGIRISENSFNCRMERNSFYCNKETGIELRANANATYQAPTILSATTAIISGVASSGDRIELYLYDDMGCPNSPCQGKVFLGTTVATQNGAWSVSAPFAGGVSLNQNHTVTALAADFLGNTSTFGNCFELAPACAISVSVNNVTDASCDRDNGAFNVSVAGGTGFYSFDIGNGPVPTSFFNNLSPGIYSVTITDGSGCSTITGVTINSTDAPSASVINQNDAFCNEATGSFTVSVFGGSSPYSYNIGNGETNNSLFNNLSHGDYTVSITDNNGCQVSVNASIGNTPAPTASITNLLHASCEQENGSFSVIVAGGTAPFTFDIGNGPLTNNTFSALPPDTYVVTVTDANNCTTQQQATINASSPPMGEVTSITDATCNQNNGGFTLAVTEGTAPYSFDMGNGSTSSPIFGGLASGTYTVTITDANNCEDIEGITVGSTQIPIGNTTSVESATCGQSNGSFQIEVFGGTFPFTYDIGNGPINQGIFNGLSGGLYSVTITDATGCTDVQGVNVPNASPPVASIDSLSNAGCGQGNGFVAIGLEGGTAPYIYNIGDGPTNSPIFDDLPPGNYNINITDANDCSANLVVTIGGASPPQVEVNDVQNSSCGQSNGAFIIAVSVGLPPYSFDIGNGPSSNVNFTGLSPGDYNLTVTDANDCNVVETISIEESEGPSANISDVQNAACGGVNGSFSVDASGGTPPYSFDMGNGSTTDTSFTGLSPGDYNLTVTDANDCNVVETISIEASDGPSANISDVQDATCGRVNGSFSVEASGGTPPYSFNIGDGSTTDANFTALSSGDYNLTVTDANDCSVVESINIGDSEGPSASISNLQDVACGGISGSFSVEVSGGTPPYSFDMGNGSTTDATFNDLDPGDYTVSVSDANGCTTQASVSIGGSAELVASIFDVVMPSCGLNNGSFSVIVEGGIPPFNYNIGFGNSDSPDFNNLLPDTYFVTVTDSGNCSDSRGVTLVNNELGVNADFSVSRTDFTITLSNNSFGATAYSWTFGDGNSSTDENPIHTYTEEGEFTICLNIANDCSSDVACQAIVVGNGIEDPKASITGILVTETGQAIDLAEVACTEQTPFSTTTTGKYEFVGLPINNTYTIRPEKHINYSNGISTFDLFLITEHILTEDTLDSPYKIIAADVNNSGSVTNFDIVKLRKLILGIDTVLEDVPSWRFIPEDFTFPNPINPFVTPFPESKDVSIIEDVDGVNFIGIKMGDVNNSVEQGMFRSTENRNRNNFYININNQLLEPGHTYNIALTSKDLKNLLGFQFTLEWDKEILEVVAAKTGNLTNLASNNLNVNFLEKGQLTSSWVKKEGDKIAEHAVLLYLQLQPKQPIRLSNVLTISSAITQQEAYRQSKSGLALENVALHFVSPPDLAAFELNISPNPFSTESQLSFYLPEDDQLSFQIFDGTGKLLWTETLSLKKGEQQLLINQQQLGDYRGVLFFQLNTTKNRKFGKLIRF